MITKFLSGANVMRPSDNESDELRQTTLTVPPETAVIPLTLSASNKSFASTAADLEQLTKRVTELADNTEHATFALLHATTPLWDGDDIWRAQAQARITISLMGADTVPARLARLAPIMEALQADSAHQRAHGHKVKSSAAAGGLQIGTPVPSLHDVTVHRETLLDALLDRLRSVAREPAPPQWRPADLRCHSTGIVTVVHRSLSGIVLALEVRTDVVFPAGTRGAS